MATHVAEKRHAYTLPRPNSRVRDLPDIALLATVADLASVALRSAIGETFAHKATHAAPSSSPDPARSWEPVYARMAASDDLPWRTFDGLVLAARAFLVPVLAGTEGRWDPREWAWRDEHG